MIHQLSHPPAAGIPLRRADLPRTLPITDYCRRAAERGYLVAQYRQHIYLVQAH